MDLTIIHRSGKRNTNADALSRFPTSRVVAAVTECSDEDDLPEQQRSDPKLLAIITYLDMGILPKDDRWGKQIGMASSQYTVLDRILYRVVTDGTLRLIPPSHLREQLFHEVHAGKFGADLSDAKVYSEIQRHYWWEGMRKDITQWTRGCPVCATRRAVRVPLSPIPVSGPFDRVGVDIIQFPQTKRGNCYAVVFIDYLTKWPETFAVPDQSSATVAKLLVEEIVSRHGIPSEVLSDRGQAFLSGLMKEVALLHTIPRRTVLWNVTTVL